MVKKKGGGRLYICTQKKPKKKGQSVYMFLHAKLALVCPFIAEIIYGIMVITT